MFGLQHEQGGSAAIVPFTRPGMGQVRNTDQYLITGCKSKHISISTFISATELDTSISRPI
jgi:hypothetical protein